MREIALRRCDSARAKAGAADAGAAKRGRLTQLLEPRLATLREIMLLQELRHENVIELIEVYVHNQSISLVFEF